MPTLNAQQFKLPKAEKQVYLETEQPKLGYRRDAGYPRGDLQSRRVYGGTGVGSFNRSEDV